MPHFIKYYYPILVAIAAGSIAFSGLTFLPMDYREALSWDFGVTIYISVLCFKMLRSNVATLKRHARHWDVSGKVLFLLLIIAAFFSLYLSLSLLHEAKSQEGWLHHGGFALAAMTIILSWLFVQMIFAVHYTHHYYAHIKKGKDAADDTEGDGGLEFPQAKACGEAPDFADFLYFSFVLGMTFQVSDVQVTRHHMRHIALAHGVIAFFFNTFILASSVNIAASLFE